MNQVISRGHPARVVEVQAADDLLDQPLLVLAVEDLEALRQSGFAPVQAQQPVARCRGTYRSRAVPTASPSCVSMRLRISAAALFVNVTARMPWGETPSTCDQPFDAVREHARLAAARAGEHERRHERRGDRLALRIVERR